MIDLKGKTALVTGGAKRLGAAIARELARHGVRVAVHYRLSEAEALSLVDELRASGVEAWALQADLEDVGQAPGIIDAAWRAAGQLDLLVNSASIFPEGRLDALDLESLLPNISVNALSPFALCRELAARSEGGAAVVNLLDTRVVDYDREHVAYHLSKRMLHALTRMMAVEYAPRLRVNAVAPGLVLPPAGQEVSYLAGLAHTNALNMYGAAEDVAEAVTFLLRSDFITGQTVYVDGGRHLKGNMYG